MPLPYGEAIVRGVARGLLQEPPAARCHCGRIAVLVEGDSRQPVCVWHGNVLAEVRRYESQTKD